MLFVTPLYFFRKQFVLVGSFDLLKLNESHLSIVTTIDLSILRHLTTMSHFQKSRRFQRYSNFLIQIRSSLPKDSLIQKHFEMPRYW